ncbi:MAG: hypothetical protein AB1489_30875, partial [Acidobacteriota bacterium]
ELGVLMFAQTSFMQRWLRTRAEEELRREHERQEQQVVAQLPANYIADFQSVKHLCQEIERRAAETENNTVSMMTVGLIDKLSSFRLEYARMLRAHYLLANRNYKEMRRRLIEEIKRAEQNAQSESSPQVRMTLEQNLKILHQRATKLQRLDDLVRLLEARLQVVRNSLQLIQDEVYSMTDVHGISDIVDGLLVNLQLSEEFRASYDDVLSEQSPMLAGLDNSAELAMTLEPEFTPESQRKQSQRQRQRKAQ